MIFTRRILRTALPFSPHLRYWESSQKLVQLTKEAQRALWANHFIKTISSEDFQTNLKSPSLQDKLIDSPNPTLQHKYDQAIKKQMTDIFTKGVYLNPKVFDSEQIGQSTCQEHKFVFYPNLFVTRPIFCRMDRDISLMFQGAYGIGKSFSIILFICLTDIINKYVFLATKKGEEELLKEYKDLVKKKYLSSYFFKYWYWSINWKAVQSSDFSLQRLFAEQATELTQEEREDIKNCKTIQEAQKMIRKLYKSSKIIHFTVVDQINHVIDYIIKWNSFVKENKKLIKRANSKKSIKQEDLVKINHFFLPASKLSSLIRQFTGMQTFNFVLNSTARFDKNLLFERQTEYLKYQPLTLQLKLKNRKHEDLRVVPLTLKIMNQSQSEKIHFWQLFTQLLQEKLRNQKRTASELKEFKTAFLEYACSLDTKQYYQFLSIKQCLQTYKVSNIFLDGRDKNEIVRQIVQKFNEEALREIQNRFRRFITQSDSNLKTSLLRALYIIAIRQKAHKIEKIVVDCYLTGQMIGLNQQRSQSLGQFFGSDKHTNYLFPIIDDTLLRKIKLGWSPQSFIQIVKDVIFPNLIPCTEDKDKDSQEVFETLLRNLLTKDSNVSFRTATNERQINGAYQNNGRQLYFEEQEIFIQEQKSFVHFNSESASKTFENHFQQILSTCTEMPGKWVVSFPNKGITSQKDDLVKNQPSVDFALTKCFTAENEKCFVICTFDASVGYTSLKQKEAKTKDFFLHKASKFQSKVEVRHHILCLEEHCLPALPINRNVRIFYSDIMKMEIKGSPERSAEIEIFNEVKMLMTRFYKIMYNKS